MTGYWLPLVDVLASVPPERCDYCAPGLPCVLHLDASPAGTPLAATDEAEYPPTP